MTIKTNVAANSVSILATDTILLNSSADERKAISFASLHELTGLSETVELFISADSTSESGERLDKVSFGPNNTKNPLSMLLTVQGGSYLIGKATNGARVECNISYTLYDGSD